MNVQITKEKLLNDLAKLNTIIDVKIHVKIQRHGANLDNSPITPWR
jgi:hypothetical protein